jgi:hypothetical protein
LRPTCNRSSPRPGARKPVGRHGLRWGVCASGRRGSCAYIATCEPPSDQWMDGSALGRAHAGRQGKDRRSVAGCMAPRGSKRSRCPRPREARSSLGKARPTSGTRVDGTGHRDDGGPRRAGRRDVAARPRSGAARFRLSHFEHNFLPKLEHKCTTQ